MLTTAGGLVFTGTPEGYLKAFDAKTGKELWKFNVGTGIVAPPIAWEQDGEEMIGVVGRLGRRGAAVGRRSRQVLQGHRPGRLLLGVQAAAEDGGQLSRAASRRQAPQAARLAL